MPLGAVEEALGAGLEIGLVLRLHVGLQLRVLRIGGLLIDRLDNCVLEGVGHRKTRLALRVGRVEGRGAAQRVAADHRHLLDHDHVPAALFRRGHGRGQACAARTHDHEVIGLGLRALELLLHRRNRSLQQGEAAARLAQRFTHRLLKGRGGDRGARDAVDVERLVAQDLVGELFHRHAAHQAGFAEVRSLNGFDPMLVDRYFNIHPAVRAVGPGRIGAGLESDLLGAAAVLVLGKRSFDRSHDRLRSHRGAAHRLHFGGARLHDLTGDLRDCTASNALGLLVLGDLNRSDAALVDRDLDGHGTVVTGHLLGIGGGSRRACRKNCRKHNRQNGPEFELHSFPSYENKRQNALSVV